MKQSNIFITILHLTSLLIVVTFTNGFSIQTIPIMGIGALLLKPKNTILQCEGDDEILVNAARCFTDAFWNGKNGGVKELSLTQSKSLTKSQISEFRKRYGLRVGGARSSGDRRSELVVCQNKKGEIMGCAGIEVSKVSTPNGKSIQNAAPLMSNLAVGKKFRRRGLAEDLVKATEEVARKQWGYDECYLFVEKQNTAAVKLYRKLGYVQQWEDETAKTLVPTARGAVVSSPTTIVCMRKRIGGGLLGRFFS